jgi:hypothetical protein
MKQIKFFVPSILVLLSIIFYSCGKCGGCDDIMTTNGAFLSVYDSIIDLRESSAFASISIKAAITETKGDRNCYHKDLVICSQDGLSLEKITVTCDKELKLREGTVPAMTNLLEVKYVLETTDSGLYTIPHIILRAHDKMSSGVYTFMLTGTTKEGKPINDTTTITWY